MCQFKKVLTTFFAVVLVISLAICTFASETVYGDLNGDGKVNSADVEYLNSCLENSESYPLTQFIDLDDDGNITEEDALLLLRHVLNPEKYPLVNTSKFKFELNEDGSSYILVSVEETATGDIVVPDFYLGLPVTRIAGKAFENNDEVSSVTLPNTVEHISEAAFFGCDNLSEIYILNENIAYASSTAILSCDALDVIYFAGNPYEWDELGIIISDDVEVITNYGHDYVYKVTIEAGCDRNGVKTYTCLDCERSYEETIDALGHTVIGETVYPTCTENGYTIGVCSDCEKEVVCEIPSSGYVLGDLIEFYAQTCADSGYYLNICEICDEEIKTPIPKYDHTIGEFYYNGEYCDGTALGSCKCTKCGEIIYEITHCYSVTTVFATCTEDGLRTEKCSVCGDVQTKILYASGHVAGERVLVAQPSCSEDGAYVYYCEFCETELECEVIPKLYHSFTLTSDSENAYYVCNDCGYSYEDDITNKFKISFVTEIGNPVADIYTATDEVPVLPELTSVDYEFIGWYRDESFTTPYNSENIVTDTVLYANWKPEFIQFDGSIGSAFEKADASFEFTVISPIPLTDSNLSEYVTVKNSSNDKVSIFISSSSGNEYTISGYYYTGDIYKATVVESFEIVGSDNGVLWFVVDGMRKDDVTLKEGVTVIPSSSVCDFYEYGEKTYMVAKTGVANVGDTVVISDDSRGYILAATIVGEEETDGLIYYEYQSAAAEDVFAEYNVFINEGLDLNGIDFTEYEDAIISNFYNSDLYYTLESAADQYVNSISDAKYKYELGEIKPKVSFKVQGTRVIGTLKVGLQFYRTEIATGNKEIMSFELKVGLKYGIDFTYSARNGGLSNGNFAVILEVDKATSFELTITAGNNIEDASEKKAFLKKVIAKVLEADKKNGVDKQGNGTSVPTPLTTPIPIPSPVGFITLDISFENEFYYAFAVEAGLFVENRVSEKYIIESVDWDIDIDVICNQQTNLDLYFAGSAQFANTIRAELDISLIGVAGIEISAGVGPYFEVGGIGILSFVDGVYTDSNLSGYYEFGLLFNIKADIEVFKIGLLKDNGYTLYEARKKILSGGEKELPLYFEEYEEEFVKTASVDDVISIEPYIDREIVVQNLITFEQSYRDATDLSYAIVEGDIVADVTSSGSLIVRGCDLDGICEVKVKVTSGAISKYVTFVISVDHDHVFTSSILRRATCTKPEMTRHTCRICSFYYDEETAPALGHSGEWIATSVAACDIPGCEYRVCDLCGIIEYRYTDALEHDFSRMSTDEIYLKSEANCQNVAVYYYSCVYCERSGEETFEYGGLGDHVYNDPHTCHDRECTVPGCGYISHATTSHSIVEHRSDEPYGCQTSATEIITRYCENCGYIESSTATVAHHSYVLGNSYPATCEKSGVLYHIYCEVCGFTLRKEIIPAYGHTTKYVYDPERDGHAIVCRRDNCGKELDFEAHEWTVTKSPTCESYGYETASCDLCNFMGTRLLNPIGHQISGMVISPTCTDSGYIITRCVRAGCNYEIRQNIEPLGHIKGKFVNTSLGHKYKCARPGCNHTFYSGNHTFGDWIIKREAQCGKNGGTYGTKYKVCSVCGYYDYESIPAPECILGPEATCTEHQRCTVCGDIWKYRLGHKKVYVSIDDETHKQYCVRCGEIFKIQEHRYTDLTFLSKATCTEGDTHRYECLLCDYYYEKYYAPLGHEWVEVDAKDPTCNTDGYSAHKRCERCKETTAHETFSRYGEHDYTVWYYDAESHYRYCNRAADGNCNYSFGHKFSAEHDYGPVVYPSSAGYDGDGGQYKVCRVCNYKCYVDCQHSKLSKSSCTEPTVCLLCRREIAPAPGHKEGCRRFGNGTHKYYCENASKVAVCNYTPRIEACVYVEIAHKEAKCYSKGYIRYKCTACGDIKDEELKVEHSLEWIPAQAPTCTSNGWYAYTKCTNDGCSYNTKETIPARSALWSEWEVIDTQRHYRYCLYSDCDNAKHKETKAHSIEVVSSVDATCEIAGYKKTECRDCGYGTTEHYDPIGHNIQKGNMVDPTCNREGYTEYFCTRTGCNYSYTADYTSRSHSLVSVSAKEPTCTTTGWYAYEYCDYDDCGYTTFTKRGKLPHNYKQDFDSKYHWEECTDCGRVKSGSKSLHKNHVKTWTILKETTCTEDGLREGACSVCKVLVKETVRATGHKPDTNENRLCTEPIRCTVCLEILIPAGEHDLKRSNDLSTDPTCTEEGIDHKTCRKCSYFEDVITDPIGHDPAEDNWITSENGEYHYHECKNGCGEELDISEHSFGDWYTTSDPKCESEGEKERECADCGHKEQGSVPALGHEYYVGVEEERINHPDGSIEYIIRTVWLCHNECGYREVIDEYSHRHGATGYDLTDPTCTEPGYITVYCKDCSEILIDNEEIPPLGHDFVEGVCTRCGASEHPASEGLRFTLSNDGTYYSVTGIGTCTDLDIVIPSTHKGLPVKEIGYRAFYECGGITSVVIPNSVTSIGELAFEYCSSLTSVVIPDSVTSIGNLAFGGCYSLTSIVIPDSVTSIGEAAFDGCGGLKNIDISNGVKLIEQGTFRGCDSLKSIVIPDSVTSIGYQAFCRCVSLTSIEIPNSVTSIGEQAFSSCYSLTSIEIPDSVTSIGEEAFGNCNLTSIVIPDSVTSIGNEAFYYTNVGVIYYRGSVGDWKWTDVFADSNIFYYSEKEPEYDGYTYWHYVDGEPELWIDPNYVSYDLEFTLSSDGTYYSVSGIGDCTSGYIVIPDTYEGLSVTAIKEYAFEFCRGFISITIPDSVTSIGACAFYNCSSLTSIAIPDGVPSIDHWAFHNCSSLTSIVIPDSVTSIGHYAFDGCRNLTSIVIPDSVTSIGSSAFNCCSSIESIVVDDGNTSYYSEGNCLVEISTKTLIVGCMNSVIPDSVTSIGISAFYNCTSLTSIVIPDSVTSIGNSAFLECTRLTSVEIHDGVTSIGNSAFSDCYRLTSIEIPDSVTSIGDNAFKSCGRLTSIIIPNSVTSIGHYAFEYCSSLTSVVIPDSVTSIGNLAFGGCYSLTSIEIPNSVTSIGEQAFSSCYSLTSIEIPDSVTSIGDYAFYGCSGLTSIEIPDGVTLIGNYAFAGLDTLTSIEIPDSVTSIGNEAFYYTNVGVIYYRGSVGDWKWTDVFADANIFYYSEKEPEYDGYTYWHYVDGEPELWIDPNYVSYDLEFTLSSDGTYYSVSGIGDCTSGYIVIPDMYEGLPVTEIQADGFKNIYGFISVTIPDGVTSIGEYAFYYCISLTRVVIPDSVTSIGDYVFVGCTGLVEVLIPNGIKTIGDGTFSGCSSLTSIVIPDSVTSIGWCAFSSCSSLTSIVIPDSVTSIGDYAFGYCSSLTSITYGGTIDQWNAISKGFYWNYDTPNYTVYCTDGTITKQ